MMCLSGPNITQEHTAQHYRSTLYDLLTTGFHHLIRFAHHTRSLPSARNNCNCSPMKHATCCEFSMVHLATTRTQMKNCSGWCDINRCTHWSTQDNKHWTNLLGIRFVSPAFSVDVIWANIVCLLPLTILTRHFWMRSLRTRRRGYYTVDDGW